MRALIVVFLCISNSGLAQGAEVGRFGCEILDRPAELTFNGFSDAWRSIAADRLYSLTRHQNAVEVGTCDCGVLRPDWTETLEMFEALGFSTGPSSAYRDWSSEVYSPQIADLRRTVQDMCGGAN
ncbi:hypothetical protein E2K80_04730 [Rhodophyticola sp. CCM32]|uniref:hypothetical protein n=1 Tax=Rhodophyticola sp. CCM32 TaxID=2916397 RepID=UPI00107F730A|nr:hypothetical protein [Rhodophyticola sp. CCM32]QBY00129.1 hypothetical protein E2K80_04730 [Rhodophyticola sp. CCM32]